MVHKNMNTYRFSIENFISTDIAQLAYYIIADAKWTNRSINSSSSVRFSVIISTNDLYVAVEARSPTWPVGSISVVAQCSIHCTAQRCISIISRLVKNSEPNRFITCRRNLIFTSNLAMFCATLTVSGSKNENKSKAISIQSLVRFQVQKFKDIPPNNQKYQPKSWS